MNKYNSFILLEIVFSIILLSIIFITSTKLILDINKKNKNNYSNNISKLELETTKLFLLNKLHSEYNLNYITYSDDKVFYDSNILLKNVTDFRIKKEDNTYNVYICINIYNEFCLNWILK